MIRFAPSRVRIALTLLALTLSLAVAAQAVPRASSSPPLRPQRLLNWVPSPMPYPWVIGKAWPRHTTVTLTVYYRGAVGHAGLNTGSDGAFGIAIEEVRWCTGLVIQAVDATNYRVVLHGVNLIRSCPAVTEKQGIVIHSLSKRELHAHEYLIDGRRAAPSYTVRAGDMMYVYVRQTRLSLRSLDRRHFRLIEHGVIPVCPPNVDCAFPPGTYYRVLVLHVGRASLPTGHGRYARIEVIA